MAYLQLQNPRAGRPMTKFIQVCDDKYFGTKIGYVECEACGINNCVVVHLGIISELAAMAREVTQKKSVFVNIAEIIKGLRKEEAQILAKNV